MTTGIPDSLERLSHTDLIGVHAERLVHKLVPANDKQRNAIEVAKRMIWWFYGPVRNTVKVSEPICGRVVDHIKRSATAQPRQKRQARFARGSLKEYKLAPSPQQAKVLRARFDRIFNRGRTGYVILDRLLIPPPDQSEFMMYGNPVMDLTISGLRSR